MWTTLVTWQLQSLAVLAIALVATFTLRRARARHRHDVWLFALLATAALPLLPRVRPPAALTPLTIAPATVAQTTADLPLAAPGLPVPLLAWLAVSLFLLLRLAVSHARLRRLTRSAHPLAPLSATPPPPPTPSTSPAITAPFTAGLFHPRIYVPAHLATERAVLTHEQAHARARDPLVRFLTDVYAALAWPNPLVWLARAQLHKEQELAADEAVLDAGITASTYAEVLMQNARASIPAAVGMASALPARIASILSHKRPRRARIQTWLSFAILSAAVALTCCEALPTEGAKIDPAEVQEAFRMGRDTIRACYEAALRASPTLAVGVVVELEISANGEPSAVRINDVPAAADLAPCLIRAVSALRFAPHAGGPVRVQYPLSFWPEAASVREQAKTRFAQGNELLMRNEIDDAIAHYDEATQIDASFAPPHRGLGIAHARKGNGDAAVAHYKMYLKLFPSAPDAPQVQRIIEEYESTED